MLVLLALSSPSSAIAPSETIYIGQEPTRLHDFDAPAQDALRQSAAWQSFVQGEGHDWTATFDADTGTVFRAWGAGIEMDTSSEEALLTSVRAFFERNPDLLGVSVGDLQLRTITDLGHTDSWSVSLARVVRPPQSSAPQRGFKLLDLEEGIHPVAGRLPNQPPAEAVFDHNDGAVPVWRGNIELRIRHGNLVMLGIGSHPGATAVDTDPTLSPESAVEVAMELGPEPFAEHTVWGAELMILPWQVDHGLEYRLVWKTQTRTYTPQGLWTSFVDAHDGELLNVHNEVRYVAGTLYGEHDTRTVDGDLSISPLPYLDESGFDTDIAGAFSTDGAHTASLVGEHFTVYNDDGAEGSLALVDGDNTWTATDATQAEIDSYVFLNRVRDWAVDYGQKSGSLVILDMASHVNQGGSCNAYFDGNVNFLQESSQCNNTGRIADVNFHEWGHGFHYLMINSGTFDGSISEGIADMVSALQTEDHILAPGFLKNGSGLRELETDRVYPDDWEGEVHSDGLIFAGAVWDLWKILKDEQGEEQAFITVSALLGDAIRGGPTIPDSFAEFLAADDDNGNLADGTPNECAIIEAFSAHGLADAGTLARLTHLPLDNQLPNEAGYALDAEIAETSSSCAALASARVHYSIDDGGSWDNADLTLSTDAVDGAIPDQPYGSVVTYYIEGTTQDGGTFTVPSGGAITPFTFVVGQLEELYCESFEDDDGGYSHALLDGTDQEGADDWQWGAPQGMGGDPTEAHSGGNVWGNDLGFDGYDGQYQGDKQNRLTSVPIDVAGHDQVFLQYRRWLAVEDGYYDTANLYMNDELVWTNHATGASNGAEHHEDDQWMQHSLLLEPGADEITLGWEIDSDRGLHFGGWNIDDVCVYALAEYTPPAEETDTGDGLSNVDGGEKKGGCGCATAAPASTTLGMLGLLALGLVRRRR